jgi:hypothetical protein
MPAVNATRVLCTENKTGFSREFPSVTAVAEFIGTTRVYASNSLGRGTTCKGYRLTHLDPRPVRKR